MHFVACNKLKKEVHALEMITVLNIIDKSKKKPVQILDCRISQEAKLCDMLCELNVCQLLHNSSKISFEKACNK